MSADQDLPEDEPKKKPDSDVIAPTNRLDGIEDAKERQRQKRKLVREISKRQLKRGDESDLETKGSIEAGADDDDEVYVRADLELRYKKGKAKAVVVITILAGAAVTIATLITWGIVEIMK